ncbi:hypothetical protein, partial [Pseudomonas sp. 2995-3]|uniref:hypothetical protein n=1 Tax=Pseudomonas sp. 2995-3 TaxID=1712680 RepID=UPI000C66827D
MRHTITILGLGAGDLDQLPLGVYKELQKPQKVIARTKDHPAIHQLEEEGLHVESFDHIYESHDQFEDVYESIV